MHIMRQVKQGLHSGQQVAKGDSESVPAMHTGLAFTQTD